MAKTSRTSGRHPGSKRKVPCAPAPALSYCVARGGGGAAPRPGRLRCRCGVTVLACGHAVSVTAQLSDRCCPVRPARPARDPVALRSPAPPFFFCIVLFELKVSTYILYKSIRYDSVCVLVPKAAPSRQSLAAMGKVARPIRARPGADESTAGCHGVGARFTQTHRWPRRGALSPLPTLGADMLRKATPQEGDYVIRQSANAPGSFGLTGRPGTTRTGITLL